MADSAGTASEFNARAQNGFAKSSLYDQHRPTYSPTIVQYILDQLRVTGKKHATIVDLAAGTGKFTEALAAREENFKIIAVEPHQQMREVLESKKLKGVTVVNGMGDSMPSVGDETVDAVTVAQGFHWFANMDSLKEIHRVLQPHGALGLVWNVEDYNAPRDHKASSEWEAKVHDLTWSVAEETGDEEPRYRHLEWKKVFDEQVKKTPLSLLIASDDQLFSLPIAEHSEPFAVSLSTQQAWERYATLGHIAVLEGKSLEKTKKAFMDAINSPNVEKDGDGNVIIHGNAHAVWTTKIPAEGREDLTSVPRPEHDRTEDPEDPSRYR
ncbi:putative methyltransferase type 11, S-adenosyl-L-methionine-dependent methyltransferase [Septoria linicola]|nr:putative methyltransferase type 11, S-adenosyl-L-methionine-dependent methyltransferase [Septoria linicola]